MGDKVITVNASALRKKLKDAPKKIVSSFFEQAMKTKDAATGKLIEGSINLTKKQLDTLQDLDKKSKGKKKS